MNFKRVLLFAGLISFIIAFITSVAGGRFLTDAVTWDSVGGILLALGILL